jgi:hypothetical protein
MPTAGDYEVEVSWADGNAPTAEQQESIWWEHGLIANVRLDEFEVCIYRDGLDRVVNRETGDIYTNGAEISAIADTDKKLGELSADNGGVLEWVNNSWFDLYSPSGEHLDMVSHTADEAFEVACDYLIQEFVNMCQIENNQIPQVEGKKVVVVDFEE